MKINPITSFNFNYSLSFQKKTKPYKNDEIAFRNLNDILFDKYKINSSIKNPYLLKSLYEAVKDYCDLNGNNIFNGLELKEENLKGKNSSEFKAGINSDKVIITFNKKIDWKNLDKITKKAYEKCTLPSFNPKCLLYRDLAHFLNFKYNKFAYILDDDAKLKKTYSRQISNSDYANDFSANYIAGRMCGILYPKKVDETFFDSASNKNLKFPKAKDEPYKSPIEYNFSSIKDVNNYLYKKYNIVTMFETLNQAKAFCGAIEDMVKVCKDDKIFSNLCIYSNFFDFDDTSTQLITVPCFEEGKINIVINPAHDWKNEKRNTKTMYNSCFQPSDNPKNIYYHELSHYLEYRNLMLKGKVDKIDKRDYKKSYTKEQKNLAYRVSKYATTSPSEFCAEYVSGRLCGLNYPKKIDDLFKKLWLGPKLDFNQISNNNGSND